MSDNRSNVGGDDSFIAFSFAVVSVAMIILYIPWIWGIISRIFKYLTTSRKRSDETNPFLELLDTILFIPKVILQCIREPGIIIHGCRALMQQPGLTIKMYLPIFLKFIIRPKILVLWLWAFLLSLVMYSTLTFDAYAILGLPAGANMTEVKKAYRKMSKMYHPDHNKTETARVLYIKARKAYKSLANKDEFEEEAKYEEFTVGVALPSFLTSRDNEVFVLFGMLSLMLAIPIGLFLKFRDSDKKIVRLIQRIKEQKNVISIFLNQMGVPPDQKYVEKKVSRELLLKISKSIGIAPEDATETMFADFPLLPVFVSRALSPEQNISSLRQLGFDDGAIEILNQWASNNSKHYLDVYEQRVKAFCGPQPEGSAPVVAATKAQFKSIFFLLQIYTDAIANDIKELQKNMPNEIRPLRKIASIHREMYELINFVFEREKPLQRHVQNLINIPRQLDEAVEELVPSVEAAFRKMYKNYYEQQLGKKEFKRLQKMVAQNKQQQFHQQ